MTTKLLRLGSTTAVILDVVIQPPSGETTVREVAFLTCRPATIHLISAGGFELAVVQVRGTGSPTLASVGPDIVTWAGETEPRIKLENYMRYEINSLLHNTLISTSAFNGDLDMTLLASHLYLALLSLASAVNV